MPPTIPKLCPTRSPRISPPTIIPATPRRIVAQIGIGSGPGSASLARAPTSRPPTSRPMMKSSTRRSLPLRSRRKQAAGPVLPARGRRVARGRAGARALRQELTVARRLRGHELREQALRYVRHGVDGAGERGLVRLRRLREAADLAHVLDGRRAHLLVGGGRFEVVEHVDVAAHGVSFGCVWKCHLAWS